MTYGPIDFSLIQVSTLFAVLACVSATLALIPLIRILVHTLDLELWLLKMIIHMGKLQAKEKTTIKIKYPDGSEIKLNNFGDIDKIINTLPAGKDYEQLRAEKKEYL